MIAEAGAPWGRGARHADGEEPTVTPPPASTAADHAAWADLWWAVQLAASLSVSFEEAEAPVPLTWLAEHDALAGHPAPGGRPFRAALRLHDLRLLLLLTGGPFAELSLAGHTVAEGLARLETELGAFLGEGQSLRLPGPVAAAAAGHRFCDPPPAGMSSLAAQYRLAALTLGRLSAREPGATRPRCWSDGLHVAVLVPGDPYDDAGPGVEAGLDPGHGTPAGRPCWYARPLPPPGPRTPAPLRHGAWTADEGWVARREAVALAAGADEAAAAREAGAFLDEALAACRELLPRRR